MVRRLALSRSGQTLTTQEPERQGQLLDISSRLNLLDFKLGQHPIHTPKPQAIISEFSARHGKGLRRKVETVYHAGLLLFLSLLSDISASVTLRSSSTVPEDVQVLVYDLDRLAHGSIERDVLVRLVAVLLGVSLGVDSVILVNSVAVGSFRRKI